MAQFLYYGVTMKKWLLLTRKLDSWEVLTFAMEGGIIMNTGFSTQDNFGMELTITIIEPKISQLLVIISSQIWIKIFK